jgi:hypothetical protein
MALGLVRKNVPTSATVMSGSRAGHSLVQELLIDARIVFTHLTKYKSVGQLNVARRNKKLPGEFWESYERLNEILEAFTYAPRLDLHAVYDGSPVAWTLADDSPIAHVRVPMNWLLQVISEGAILNIRRCEVCEDWFFARVSHKTFCKRSCQQKDFSQTDDFKEKRRKYMHAYRNR